MVCNGGAQRAARDRGDASVLAEAVFDSTSNDFDPRLDALLLPGLASCYPPDQGEMVAAEIDDDLWASSLRSAAR